MSEPTLEWLKTLCHVERDPITAPFSVTVDGQKMIGATDGHGLVLVHIDGDAPTFDGAQQYVDLFAGAKWSPAPFAQVETWALRQNGRCEDCGGLGFRYQPDLQAFDLEGMGPVGNLWQPCFECRWTLRIGTIAGVRLDRFLLLRYLGPLKTGEVAIAGVEGKTGPALGLRAPGWMVMVMGVLGTEPGEVFVGG